MGIELNVLNTVLSQGATQRFTINVKLNQLELNIQY
jgi:hypothetical protein